MRVDQMLAEAECAASEGRDNDAIAAFKGVLARVPDHPRALNGLGNRLLAQRELEQARACFERACAIDPSAPPLWLNLAIAARESYDFKGEMAALDRALALDPYFVHALLQKAQCFERSDDRRSAARVYRALKSCDPPMERLAPPMRAAIQHGLGVIASDNLALEAALAQRLATVGARSRRFDYCIDLLTGRMPLYVQQPTGLQFPGLPAVPFFDNALFPWFGALEAQTDVIREELLNVMQQDVGFRPYIELRPGQPVNQWSQLNHSLDWGAFFLWENGVAHEENVGRCPITAALMKQLPLLDVPERAPTVMFSLLAPGARIPPHVGVTNIRAVVHLPLVVPPACAFRVGHETREWQVGKAWAFDDTIEHEAWNGSDQVRAILIVDAWNPYIVEGERTLLRAATEAIERHQGRAATM